MKILILNNWSGLMHFFHEYINHDENEIHYFSDGNGLKGLRTFVNISRLSGVTQIQDFEDHEAIVASALALHKTFSFDRVVAVDEFTVLPAAKIRDQLDLLGHRSEQVELYRDKRLMKQYVASRGIRVPRDLDPSADAKGLVPCVVKKADGAASQGVRIFHSYEQIKDIDLKSESIDLIEEYVHGQVFHIDGAFSNGKVAAAPHLYLTTCYDHYTTGAPIGSVLVDEPMLQKRLIDFTAQVISALPLSQGVFHLEVIKSDADELVFLEIACRVGGGEIYRNFIDVYGMDLLEFHIDSDLGLNPLLRQIRLDSAAGWLLINFPDRPCYFTGFHIDPLEADNCMYAMRSFKLGRKIELSYDYVAFAFRAESSRKVINSIEEVIRKTNLITRPA